MLHLSLVRGRCCCIGCMLWVAQLYITMLSVWCGGILIFKSKWSSSRIYSQSHHVFQHFTHAWNSAVSWQKHFVEDDRFIEWMYKQFQNEDTEFCLLEWSGHHWLYILAFKRQQKSLSGALWCPCVNCVQRKGSTVATADDHSSMVESGRVCLTPDCRETE